MPELKIFKHQKLMNEFNEMMIILKQLILYSDSALPHPTNEELDDITNKIMKVLREDNEPMIKHKK